VVKEPLPDDYRKALEVKKGSMSPEEVQRIRAKYQDKDIYALTGATISSKAVTDGVKEWSSASLTGSRGSSVWFSRRSFPRLSRARQRKKILAHTKKSNSQLFFNGLLSENPIFRLALSMCPLWASARAS